MRPFTIHELWKTESMEVGKRNSTLHTPQTNKINTADIINQKSSKKRTEEVTKSSKR